MFSSKQKYALFDNSQVDLLPISERNHDLDLSIIMPIERTKSVNPVFEIIAKKIVQAREQKRSVILMMGAHVIRSGVQRYIIDFMTKGLLSCIAMNGACIIHDYEFALIGKTTESVSRYIKEGQFGLWKETSYINTIVSRASNENIGLGEAIGREIYNGDYPNKEVSFFYAGYKYNIPITVHVGIGYDIVYEHPNCDGGAWGKTSYIDFLIYTNCLESLEGGVVMNFGTAVMGPEIFLKALAMVRNKLRKEGKKVNNFSTLVCDLKKLPANYHHEPPKDNPEYFFRPWKTMLVRSVADGGISYYIEGNHRQTIPELWTAINNIL